MINRILFRTFNVLTVACIAANAFAGIQNVYFGGDMNAAPALAGQSAGLIHAVQPVQAIIEETVAQFFEINERLGRLAATRQFG